MSMVLESSSKRNITNFPSITSVPLCCPPCWMDFGLCCSRVSSSGAASVSFCSWPDPFHRPWTWFATLPHLGLWVDLITRTWPCPQCSNPGLCPVGEEPAPGADSSCSSLAESSSVVLHHYVPWFENHCFVSLKWSSLRYALVGPV